MLMLCTFGQYLAPLTILSGQSIALRDRKVLKRSHREDPRRPQGRPGGPFNSGVASRPYKPAAIGPHQKQLNASGRPAGAIVGSKVVLGAGGRPVSAANATVARGTLIAQPTTTPGATNSDVKAKGSTLPFRKHPDVSKRALLPSVQYFPRIITTWPRLLSLISTLRRSSLDFTEPLPPISSRTVLVITATMETRFRRYLTSRRLSAEPSQTGYVLDDLDIYSVPYEATKPSAKAPIFISQPLPKSTSAVKRTTDGFEGLAIRAFSYDSVLPGKPPILGGRPYKGNGPVKLQTSRRLSSGELLTTTQDDERTLEDIREGDYIVGRKEKRHSQLSQIKTSSPSLVGPASPRFQESASVATPRQSSLAEQGRQLPSPTTFSQTEASASPLLAASMRDSPPATPRLLPPELLPPDSGCGIRTSVTDHLSANAMPPKIARARVPSSTASLLSRNEEQNATIQALWKAEYGRLVAIYGQDGVDRNIAELNRDHQRPLSIEVADGSHDHHLQPSMMFQPLPKPPFDAGWTTNSARSSQGSLMREISAFDDASDYSSQKPSSIMSSEGSSSSYTKRTSFYESDLTTTREDVRRVVDNMRSNYLKAIESTAKVAEGTKTKRKPRVRASLPNASTAIASPLSMKPPKAARQSWHVNNVQATATTHRKKMKTKPAAARPPSPMLKTSPSKSSVKSKVSLKRADSLTLGALVPQIASSDRIVGTESPIAEQTYLPAQQAPSTTFPHDAAEITMINHEQSVEAH